MRRRQRTIGVLVLTLLVGGTGALVSCNWIVGAGDYVVGDGGADATSNTPAPSTEAGGDVGTVGASDGGVATDAGQPACGQGLPVGQSDFSQLVSTCVLTVSCDPYFFPLNISQCISNDYLPATGSVACLSKITDCAGFYRCQGFGFAAATDCPRGPASTGCDTSNNRAVNCTVDDAGRAFDTVQSCSKLGGTCGAYSDPAAGTAVADCVVVPTCDAGGGGGSQCAGSKLYTCINGIGYGQDCTSTISTCETVNGSTSCYLDAPPCTSPGYACNGSVLEWCTSAHTQLSYNCARAGQSCVLDDAGGGQCVAPGCSLAAASSCVESCGPDGHTMTVCVGGAPLDIDCMKYPPFTACATAENAGTRYAYCN